MRILYLWCVSCMASTFPALSVYSCTYPLTRRRKGSSLGSSRKPPCHASSTRLANRLLRTNDTSLSFSLSLYQRSFFSMLNQTEKVHKTRAYAVRFARGKINLGSRWEICLTIWRFLCRGGKNRFLFESWIFFFLFFLLFAIRLFIVYWNWLILFSTNIRNVEIFLKNTFL